MDIGHWTLDFARALDVIVFYSLLGMIALVAIPYGSVEPWWKSVFQCLVFSLAILSLVAGFLKAEAPRTSATLHHRLLWPVFALIAFAFLQTISLPSALGTKDGGTISADPFQTRQFILQLLALLMVAWLLVTHTNSRKRLRRLVEIVIAVGTLSALFGLWRHASQRSPGFVLSHLQPGYGYGQFINANHFAFLIELALGLALGIVVCRGVNGKRVGVYLIAAVPMWIALVLAGSRGGILSLLCQVIFLGLLFSAGRDSRAGADESHKLPGRALRVARNLAVRSVLIVALLAGAITTVVLVGGDPLAGRVDSLAIELDRNIADTFTLRPAIWRATWTLVKDHAIAGVGFGGYWIAITKYHAASGATTPQEAHNDYLELLASGGVIGLAIGFWFAFALIKTARDKLSELRSIEAAGNSASYQRAVTLGALAGILTVGIHSLVDFGLHITINALVFTVLIAMVCVSSPKSKVPSPKSEQGT